MFTSSDNPRASGTAIDALSTRSVIPAGGVQLAAELADEGGELFALNGARNAIERFRPVVMVEINKDTFTAAGYSTQTVYDYFASLNYNPYGITKHGDLQPAIEIPELDNIVFKPS